jgi:hypothetical protein
MDPLALLALALVAAPDVGRKWLRFLRDLREFRAGR